MSAAADYIEVLLRFLVDETPSKRWDAEVARLQLEQSIQAELRAYEQRSRSSPAARQRRPGRSGGQGGKLP